MAAFFNDYLVQVVFWEIKPIIGVSAGVSAPAVAAIKINVIQKKNLVFMASTPFPLPDTVKQKQCKKTDNCCIISH